MQLQKENLGKVAITIEEGYWDINKDYDKLTIVEKEGTFGTFISRKPVPAGVTLTDRKYWIPFSSLKEEILLDYNAFIAKYSDIIEEINNTIDEHTSTLDEHSNSIEEILSSKQQWENKVLYINITYKELVEKRNAKLLIPGVNYRIIDYDTIAEGTDCNGVRWKSAMHPFDIIVQAIDNSTLSHQAKAAKSKRDVDNYFDAEDLAGWQLWYDLDNDTKYDWAQENAKGIIYRMIDSNNNDIPYDFKNIMFERYSLLVTYENTIRNTDMYDMFFLNSNNVYYENSDTYEIKAPIACDSSDGMLGLVTDSIYAYTFTDTDKDGKFIDASNKKNSNLWNNKISIYTGDSFSLPNNIFIDLNVRCYDNTNNYITEFGEICANNNSIIDCYNCTFGQMSDSTVISSSDNIILDLVLSTIKNCNYILSKSIYYSILNNVRKSCINNVDHCLLENTVIDCYHIENSKIKNSNFYFLFDENVLSKLTYSTKELLESIVYYRYDELINLNVDTFGDKHNACIFQKLINDLTIMDI